MINEGLQFQNKRDKCFKAHHSLCMTYNQKRRKIETLPGEIWSPKSTDKPMIAGRTTTAAQRSPQDTGTKRLPGMGVFQSQPVPRADPVPQRSIPKYCQERAGLPGVPLSIGKTTTSAQIPGPRGTHPEPSGHRNQGTARDRILLVSICTLELTLCHSSPYPNSSQRELVCQDY